ncbi:SNARE associated Golgi protein-like protein [Staphylothermus hellenicus DSM 12710]|uniref:SNARE associated Golgi protein-like protein n=1 Tax=Staphylothermus hellenicus (strain DSM 12710 / JCM 10830 / BK20S6-10-b1 / P8) TaxID=591019 RepID=D7D842_STAHD|nr:SNARE associated Golgi protein-like protein [Staphylothermus hellenicus DSM 12710]
MPISQALSWLIYHYGVLGVFIVSLIGNAIPYSTIPYLIFIVLYSGSIHDPILHTMITFAGGLGATIGKVIVYYFGWGIRQVLPENMKENLELFTKLFKKSTFITIFIFAASPLPDDIVYIPLGATKYSLKKYFTALLAGKIVITGLAVFFGSSIEWAIRTTTNYPEYITLPILIVLTLYLTYVIGKIKWNKIARIMSKKGFAWATIHIIIEVFRITINMIIYPFKKIIKHLT